MSKARGLADLGNAFDDGALSNRNMIINGGMVIDQRNGGASVTGSASAAKFAADRFSLFANTTGTITIQQVSDAPDGFANSNKVTCTSAATSDSSATRVQLYHAIEGHNIANLAFGSSSAKAITLSFWVKASNTGTYGGSFVNGATNRSYPYQYTISASNTWEYKIITISGDTTGTWATDNTTGMYVFWSLGIGSNFEGTANQWNGAFDIGPPSSFSLKDNLNATLQITGVQLEVGDTATPFEHRSYSDELQRCQRYFEKNFNQADAPSAGLNIPDRTIGVAFGPVNHGFQVNFAVTKRTAPTMVYYRGNNAGSANSGTVNRYNGSAWLEESISGGGRQTETYAGQDVSSSGLSVGSAYILQLGFTADAEL